MFIQHFVMLKYWLEESGRRFPTLGTVLFLTLSKPAPDRRVLYAWAIHTMSHSEEGRESSLIADGRLRPGTDI